MTDFKKTFTQAGDFMAYGFAKGFLFDRGFSVGHMREASGERPAQPAAIRHGQLKVLPWNNLTDKQKRAMDGVMTGDPRKGPITITIRDTASAEAQQAIRRED